MSAMVGKRLFCESLLGVSYKIMITVVNYYHPFLFKVAYTYEILLG